MQSILIVEDEQHLADGLRFNLELESFTVEVVDNGEAALELLREKTFDLVVLDVMLPGMNGFEVVSRWRAERNFVPVLMLTARGRSEDVLEGLEAGADDYLPKPFELAILIARIRGLLRRREWLAANGAPEDTFTMEDRVIDFDKLEIRGPEGTQPLTLMEAKLLRHLIRNEDKPVSRREILEQVWELHEETDTRAMDNFIVRLRRYLEKDPAQPEHLLTVRGVGYRFVR